MSRCSASASEKSAACFCRSAISASYSDCFIFGFSLPRRLWRRRPCGDCSSSSSSSSSGSGSVILPSAVTSGSSSRHSRSLGVNGVPSAAVGARVDSACSASAARSASPTETVGSAPTFH